MIGATSTRFEARFVHCIRDNAPLGLPDEVRTNHERYLDGTREDCSTGVELGSPPVGGREPFGDALGFWGRE